MRALLDTHVFLWWITDNSQLSPLAREIISNGENELFFSAASGWEIAIKAKLGKLRLPGDICSFIAEQLAINDFTALPVQVNHALHVYTLPDYHRDPFDRLLIAQAQTEDLFILTADPQFARYQVKVVW